MPPKKEIRKYVKERRERDWIKQTLALTDKSPKDSLEIFFDLTNFAQKLNRSGNRK